METVVDIHKSQMRVFTNDKWRTRADDKSDLCPPSAGQSIEGSGSVGCGPCGAATSQVPCLQSARNPPPTEQRVQDQHRDDRRRRRRRGRRTGVGTGVALSLSGGEFVTFLGATALYVLARSEVHGIRTTDVERQRLLLTAILLGQSASRAIPMVAERTGPHWAKAVVTKIPMRSIRQLNRVLGRNFVTKYGSKQGIVVLGKVVPFGIGAVIGGTVNGFVSQGIIRASNAAFGPASSSWDVSVA